MQTYLTWLREYCRRFSVTDPAMIRALIEWQDYFLRLFTVEELHGSLIHCNLTDTRFAEAHKRAITSAVEIYRAKLRQGLDQSYSYCAWCLGSGWKIVPHPGIKDGRLAEELREPREDAGVVYRDLAVCCPCAKGQSAANNRAASAKPPMTLETYEKLFPNWKQVEELRQEIRNADHIVSVRQSVELKETIRQIAESMQS